MEIHKWPLQVVLNYQLNIPVHKQNAQDGQLNDVEGMQHSSNLQKAQNCPNPEVKMVKSAEGMHVIADIVHDHKVPAAENASTMNDDIAQSCKSVTTVPSKESFPSELLMLDGISPNVTEVAASTEVAHHNAATNNSDLPVHKQNAQDGQLNGFEGMQHNNNLQNQRSIDVESGKLKSNCKSAEQNEQEMSKQMVDNIGMPAQTSGNNRDALDKNLIDVSLQQRGKAPDSCLKRNKQITKENTALIPSSNSSGMVAGGKLQVVKSYHPIPYTYIENMDHEDFSIFNGENKNIMLANMRELVIKSKLWDQRQFSDEEIWEEGSICFSSAEEDQEDDYDSSREELDSQGKAAIVLWNANNPSAANSSSLLNRNAPAYIPKFNTTTGDSWIATSKNDQKETSQKVIQFLGESSNAGNKTIQHNRGQKNITPIHTGQRQDQYESSAMQISSDQRQLQNDMETTYEEWEEEEMLMQCRKDAARKGDLSPMHSKTNKKCRQRDRSWDGMVIEEANIRRPPMRIAKQKQLTQITNNKA